MTNITSDQIQSTRTLLQEAKAILIAIPSNPNLDGIAASLSLYLALSTSGKQVSIVCPSPMTVEFSRLVGVDKIGNTVNGTGSKNLVITFPYQEGSIEKVSYNIENDTFNLVIEPRESYPVITPEMVRYSYSGGNTDLIFTVSASRLSDLNNIYNNNQSLFTEKPIVNIDSRNQNVRYGKVNIIDSDVSSVSELLVSFFSSLGFTIDSDIATNLLVGIISGSRNFTSDQTSAATFEAAAICLRNGARKVIPSQPEGPVPTFPKTPTYPIQPQPLTHPFGPIIGTKTSPPGTKIVQPKTQKQPQAETPPDWLKPKIYKGSTLL